jgi:hypothetical protein
MNTSINRANRLAGITTTHQPVQFLFIMNSSCSKLGHVILCESQFHQIYVN